MKRGDVDPYRAALDALRVLALEAALGLRGGQQLGVAEVDLGEVPGAHLGRSHRHVVALDGHALARVEDRLGPLMRRPPAGAPAASRSTWQPRRSMARRSLSPIGAQAVGQERVVDVVGVELRPSTHAYSVRPPTLTRQPPHMPVPSTMIALSDTVVGTPWRAVSSATARIMGTGPTA